MEYNILLSLLDTHNEASIIATKKFKPKEVVFICNKDKDTEIQLEGLRKYYSQNFPSIIFGTKVIENVHIESMKTIIEKYKNNKVIVNVTRGERLNSLMLLHLAKQYNLQSIYLDIENKKLISFNGETINIVDEEFEDLNIKDMIESIGGSIIVDSTENNGNEVVEKLIDLISSNLDIWERLKQRLYDPKAFIHNEADPMLMGLDMSVLTEEEINIYNSILELLKSKKQIEYIVENKQYVNIKFLNNYIKTFIFKSGSWLESYTRKVIEKIQQVNDVKSGVLFLWDDEQIKVKNELDVVAVKDTVLICISCKDSEKYDEVALNELNVYAHHLGGEEVIKILVATKVPFKKPVLERAKDMGISVVIFDGHKDKFEEKLRKIILR
ncbi:DUF1887 family CARF protein [Clostridium sp. C8-1-8]|uniref:Card1-like endonuclease domain-containing protein n=1 Tax=Clostridium sp. C8-1-8 TaxID=2698831 RepID=UPI001371630D|nr:DUF1887 family CARF protein [Clostridium sp. C8-1-8]